MSCPFDASDFDVSIAVRRRARAKVTAAHADRALVVVIELGSSLILDSITDNSTALQFVESRSMTEKLLHQLSSNDELHGNLTCTVMIGYDDVKELQVRPPEQNNLLSRILLVSSVALSLIICLGWCVLLAYHECKHARMKHKQRKQMMKSVQQLLELSPTILFDASERNSACVDDAPSCAICLEPFSHQERLRQLGRDRLSVFSRLHSRLVLRSKSARIISI